MFPPNQFTVLQGTALTINPIALIGAAPPGGFVGPPITQYDGSQPLTFTVSPFGDQPAILTGTPTWVVVSPSPNVITLTITPTQSAAIPPGSYEGTVLLNDAGTSVECYAFTLDVIAAPGVVAPSLITVYPVCTELIDRCGGLMELAGKNLTPGNNPTLNGAIGFALQALGVTTATPGIVVDGDLSVLNNSLFYALCDLAEYRLIKTALLNFTDPNQTLSLERQDWNDVMKRFEARLDQLTIQYAAFLNIRRMPAVAGRMNYCPPLPRYNADLPWRRYGGGVYGGGSTGNYGTGYGYGGCPDH